MRFIILIILFFIVAHQSVYSKEIWPYRLYRANLHVHTLVSNDMFREGLNKDSIKDMDHIIAEKPVDTMDKAKKVGLNVIGLTDHDGSLKPTIWNSLGFIANNYSTKDNVVLNGFELTREGMVNSDNKPVEHINIFGSSTYTTISRCQNLNSVYDWVCEQGKKDDYLVCQFNHPTYGNSHFNNFLVPRDKVSVTDYFALLEIGSGPKIVYKNSSFGEKYYQMALQNGFRVAPTIGVDNFGKLSEGGARTYHTGIWVDESIKGYHKNKILQALINRRTFASEDKDFQVKYYCTREDDISVIYIGESAEVIRGNKVTLSIEASDIDESIGDVRIVEVCKKSVNERYFSKNTSTINEKSIKLSSDQIPTKNTICYYIKIIQKDGNWIVTAPIWINTKVLELYKPDYSSDTSALNALMRTNEFKFDINVCRKCYKNNLGSLEYIEKNNNFYSNCKEIYAVVDYGNVEKRFRLPCSVKVILIDADSGKVIDKTIFRITNNRNEPIIENLKMAKLYNGKYIIEGYIKNELLDRREFIIKR